MVVKGVHHLSAYVRTDADALKGHMLLQSFDTINLVTFVSFVNKGEANALGDGVEERGVATSEADAGL